MKDKNRGHPKIAKLPEPLKKEVETRMIEGKTYTEIEQYLKEQGISIHNSTISRYGKEFLKKFESVRISKEFAKMLAEDNADRPATEFHEANNALANQMIMEVLINDSATIEDKMAAIKAIAALQRAQVANEKLKMDARGASGAVHIAMEKLKTQVFLDIGQHHPDIAQAIIEIAESLEKEEIRP